MSGILAHLFHCFLGPPVSLCLLLYLLYFLYFVYYLRSLDFLYDGTVRQGPRGFPLIHEYRRLASDHHQAD